MSTFSTDDVRRLARLARLDLEDDEVSAFTRQLGDILEFARQIQSVDTTLVTEPVAPTAAPLREDATSASLSRRDVLTATPDHDAASGLIKVPRVIGSGPAEGS